MLTFIFTLISSTAFAAAETNTNGYSGAAASNNNPASAAGLTTKYSSVTDSPNLDTAGEWARDSISNAIIKGFVPLSLRNNYKNVITRAEFCIMAVKWVEYKIGEQIDTILAEKGLVRNPNAFTDTNDPDILAAFALGITNGTGNNRFSPNGQFTREQAATMIRNTCSVAGMDITKFTPAGFADINKASSWAVDGINFCRNNGIMVGTGNNNFSPQAKYTIAQSIITFNNISFVGRADLIALANEVFMLTNAERVKAGLPVLSQTAYLTKTSVVRANELVIMYSDTHARPDGREIYTAYDENDVIYDTYGENIARGQQTPQEVVKDWMNSPSHRANILYPGFGRLGVGVAKGGNGDLYWTQEFAD